VFKLNKVQILSETQLFSSLDPVDLQELASAAHPRHLKAGEVLFLDGEPADRLFVIVSGSIRAFRVNAKGREQILHIERSGATLAEVPVFDDGPYPATAAAEEPTVVLSLSRKDFKQICFRHPQVAWAALRLLSSRLRRHAELINELALHDVGPRLARFLLAEGEEHGRSTPEGIRLNLSLTQQQLAGRIGSVREVVSRTLTRLEHDGLISLEGQVNGAKGYQVVIVDRSSLEAYANGR
jgi:CRP/FNR family transcriptional regulator